MLFQVVMWFEVYRNTLQAFSYFKNELKRDLTCNFSRFASSTILSVFICIECELMIHFENNDYI